MSEKYSLRVELPKELEDKLKKVSSQKALSMTDWIRSQIINAPSIEWNIEKFERECPRVFSKLLFWAEKRIAKGWEMSVETRKEALKQLHSVIGEIVFAENGQALKNKFEYFDRILSHQEKTCLSSFFPFLIQFEDKEISWFQETDWYNLENGEYITLKEEVTGGFNYKGEETGLVTVNSYDAEVLNAPNMMIVDVDLVGASLLPTDPVITPYQSVALAALGEYQHDNPELGFRVYKTAGGLRYICTTEMFDPTKGESDLIMRRLLADPKYRSLCRFQETYRARLTPKPWRLEGNEAEDCKVCELIDVVGPDKIIDNFREMIDYHDAKTMGGDEELILA